MTRRNFLIAATSAAGAQSGATPRVVVPVWRVMDRRSGCSPEELNRFWWNIWPEAVRDLGRGGIQLQTVDAQGEIRRSPGGRPMFYGLERGRINLVVTDHLPASWDTGRALAGATALHDGYCVSVIALRYAHGNQTPWFSLNTCTHELLHALMGDIFVNNPKWYQTGGRESRIDWYATGLWLLHSGSGIRGAAADCIKRLRTAAARYPVRGTNALDAWVEF